MTDTSPTTETQQRLRALELLCLASEAAAAEAAREHFERTGYPDVHTPMLTVEQVRQAVAPHKITTLAAAEEQVYFAQLALDAALQVRADLGGTEYE